MKRAPIPPTRNRQRTVRTGARRLALLASLPALLGGAAAGVRQGGPSRVGARGLRGRRRPEGRAGLHGARRPDEGLAGRRDPGARGRLPGVGQLHRGHLRHEGRPPLPDRPLAAPGGAGQRQGGPGDRRGPAGQDEQRRHALSAPGRAAGDLPARAGQRALRAGGGPGHGGRGEGGPGQGDARSRLRLDHFAARRPRRHHEREGRQPGGPRREHAAHHGLPGRPDPVPGRHQRGRVPAPRPAPRRDQGQGGRGRRASS